jgi:hypothetical protein
MIVDLFLVYQFIRRLVTPFKEWDAYKLGIIDDKGNVLIKKKNFKNAQQTKAFGIFDRLVLNLKKLLEKVPGGSSRLASYAAALWLIKEHKYFTENSLLTEETSDDDINKSFMEFYERWLYYIIARENVNNLFEKRFNVEDKGSVKHHLGINTTFKHMSRHALTHIDTDNDGDVDADDFTGHIPDEITGAEKKNLTKVMLKKYGREKKHSRKGVAFESFLKKTLEEVPANSVGGGAIAGLGVGPQGEPGLTRAQQKRHQKKNFKQFVTIIKREGNK